MLPQGEDRCSSPFSFALDSRKKEKEKSSCGKTSYVKREEESIRISISI